MRPPSSCDSLVMGMLLGACGVVTHSEHSAHFGLGVELGKVIRYGLGLDELGAAASTKGEVSAAAETGVSPASSGAGS